MELAEFEQFVLPHLSIGSRGPAPKLSLYKIFKYVLKILYLGCQWKDLPIEKDGKGHPETHYTRIYRIWRRWVDNNCMDGIFAGSVSRLHEDGRLDTAVIHGDGTTTAAKNGGDNLGFSGHKKVKGDKVVAFCDRQCNVIAPFVAATGNRLSHPAVSDVFVTDTVSVAEKDWPQLHVVSIAPLLATAVQRYLQNGSLRDHR